MATFDLITVTPSSPVATDATIVFNYPAGRNAASYAQTAEVLTAFGLQATFAQGASTFTISYGGSSATVTYKGLTSLPAGKPVTLQINRSTYKTIAALTDNSGGTAAATIAAIGASYVQAEVRNAVASLAAQLNTVSGQLNALKTELDAQNLLP